MRTISYKLDDLKKVVIPIGYEGENDHTRVIIDAGEVFKQYPAAAATLKVKPPHGTIYPVVVSREGDTVIWDVKETDCASNGTGEAQFTFTENSVIVKSVVTKININRSLVATGPAPDPIEDWLDEANRALEDIQAAEVNQPTIGEDGYWYTWNQETGEYEKTETKAQGEDGDPGQPGQPGQDATPNLITVDYADLTFPVTKDTQCYHNGLLYYAKQDIATSEAWTAAHWQQTTVEEQVGLLKSGIEGVEDDLDTIITDVPSKNLYDKDACNPQDGKTYHVSSGAVTDSTISAITGLIPVSGNTEYIFSVGGLAVVKQAAYFSGSTGETFISRETIDGASFTTPSGCTFVGIVFFNTSHTTEQYTAALAVAQLERGNTASPYEPYGTVKAFTLPASVSDEGKALSPKRVANGKVTEWEYVEVGGGSSVIVDDTLTQSGEAADAKVVGDIFDSISEIVYSKNLYNSVVCEPQNGKTYNASTGAVEDGSSYAITGKIPVEAQTQYIFSTQSIAKVKRAFYFKGTTGNTYISSEVLDNAAFTTPQDCTFVALNLFAATHTSEQYAAAIAVSMLEKGNVATDYVPYSETRKISTDSLVDSDAVAGAKNYTKMDSIVNHFDKSQCVDEKYFNSTYHEIYDSANYGFSGLIPVRPNTQYNISCDKTLPVGKMASYYQEWDESKAFIQQTQQNNAFSYISQIQTGSSTHYISINLPFDAAHTTEQFNTLINTIMLVEGMQIPPTYVPYNLQPVVDHTKIDDAYQQNVDKWRGKKWLVTGTSVSYQDSHVFTGGIHEGEVCRGYIGNVSRNKPMLITNEGVSGSTLAGSDTNSLINRYQNLNFANYDFITIEYGINDFGNNVPVGTAQDAAGTSTFAACLKTIIEYALNQNPIVGLIICTDPDVRGTTTNNNGNTLKDYADVTLAIAEQYRLPVCDWYYKAGFNQLSKGDTTHYYLTADGTHPSDYGHMRMGAMLNQVFDSLLC